MAPRVVLAAAVACLCGYPCLSFTFPSPPHLVAARATHLFSVPPPGSRAEQQGAWAEDSGEAAAVAHHPPAQLDADGDTSAVAAGANSCCDEHGGRELTLQERIAASLGQQQPSAAEAAARAEALAQELRAEKRRNIGIAVGSFVSSAVAFFALRAGDPAGGAAAGGAGALALLHEMESNSPVLASALNNGKPTVVDFYADWCENCRAMAPTMRRVEDEYRGRVNFVVIDGDSSKNARLVDAFRVDGIPHLALVSPLGDVETALIGNLPKRVVEEELDALLARRELPYIGYDAFAGEDHNIRSRL